MNDDPGRQPPILSFGFRPFFLLSGLYAVLAMAFWMIWLALHSAKTVVVNPSFSGAPHVWHGHEMVFGYATAAIAGFILTAVPSWTGAQRIAGTPLLVLVTLWIIGRLAVWFSAFLPPFLVAAADMVFLPVLLVFVAFGLLVRPAPRNLIFLLILAVLVLANAHVHAEWLGLADNTAVRGLALGLVTETLLIVVVGGRVTPAFTRNALMQQGNDRDLPRHFPALDILSIASASALVICYLLSSPGWLTGSTALIVSLANGARLSFWRFSAIRNEPILWSLHLGYAWVVVGSALLAGHHLLGLLSETAALHVLGIGAVGGMTVAVMTRAALGHTGRELKVSPSITVAYILVAAAALVRSLGPAVLPAGYYYLIFLSGGLWLVGFTLFAIVYFPILVLPSVPDISGQRTSRRL